MKKTALKPLSDLRSGRILFIMCFVLYSFVVCGRLNYPAVIAKTISEGFLAKNTAGLAATTFNIAYGCCQFIGGIISDRLPPFGTISFAIAGAGVMNLAMYSVLAADAGLPVIVVVWTLNGIIQSIIWPTLIRVISSVLPEKIRVTAGASMLATTAVGNVFSGFLSSAIMHFTDWKKCFLFPAVLLIALSAAWFALTRGFSRRTVVTVSAAEVSEGKKDKKSSAGLFRLLIVSGGIFMFFPIAVMAVVKDGVSTWAPTVITETFSADPVFATLISTFIPFISIFGAAIAKLAMDKVFHNEMKSAAALYACTVLGLVLVLCFGNLNIGLTVFLFAAIIAFLLGVNTLFISLVPIRFSEYGCTAGVTGVLNSSACIAGGLSSYLVGVAAEAEGWTFVFLLFVVLAALAGTVSALIVRRWSRFRNSGV